MISYSPVSVFSGIVICVWLELFCLTCIISVLVATCFPVFLFSNWCFMFVGTVFVLVLVIVLTNVIFPPGITVLTKGVVETCMFFGAGLNNFIVIMSSMISMIIAAAVNVRVFGVSIFFFLVSFIALFISIEEYPDCISLFLIDSGL